MQSAMVADPVACAMATTAGTAPRFITLCTPGGDAAASPSRHPMCQGMAAILWPIPQTPPTNVERLARLRRSLPAFSRSTWRGRQKLGLVQHDAGMHPKRSGQAHQDGQGHVGLPALDLLEPW